MRPKWQRVAGGLPPSAYRRYLKAKGWREADQHERSWRYELPTFERGVDVEIPKDSSFADYDRRVREVIEILELVEKRTADELVFDLGQPEADVLAFRFGGASTESGTVSVTDSARIHEAQKQLLLSIAHSVIEPRVHHPRLSKAEAVQFVESCREAPPRPGSYVSPILVPVTPVVGEREIEDPFPRKVTKLLANALGSAEGALTAGDDERLLEGAETGLSSNFLAALAELRPPGDQGFTEVNFTWAARRPVPLVATRVRFDHRLFASLSEAARVLKETAPVPGTEIEGYVRSLDRGPDAPKGEIVVLATVDERPHTVKVYVTLDPDEYQRAVESHQQGARIRVSGTLAKQGRRYVLRSPGELLTVPDDD